MRVRSKVILKLSDWCASKTLILLALLGFLLRVLLMSVSIDTYNYWAYMLFADYAIRDINPYTVISHDPVLRIINPWRYPPGFYIIMLPGTILSEIINEKFIAIIFTRLLIILSDILISIIIYLFALNFGLNAKKAIVISAAYLFNPVVIILSSMHSTNDILAEAFLLLATYCLFRLINGSHKYKKSSMVILLAFWLALSLSIKVLGVLVFIPFALFLKKYLDRKKLVLYLITFIVISIVIIFPFAASDFFSMTYVLITKNFLGKSGVAPLNPFLPSTVARIVLFIILYAALMLYIMVMSNKCSIYTNSKEIVQYMVVMVPFLVFAILYLTLGISKYIYVYWSVPYAYVILSFNRHCVKKVTMIVFSLINLYMFLLFCDVLFWNGIYDINRGATGFYYWLLPLLNEHVKLFKVFPHIARVTKIMAHASFFIAGIVIITTISIIRKIIANREDHDGESRMRCKNINKNTFQKSANSYSGYNIYNTRQVSSTIMAMFLVSVLLVAIIVSVPEINAWFRNINNIDYDYPLPKPNGSYIIYEPFNTKTILPPLWHYKTTFNREGTYYELPGRSIIISCAPLDNSFIYYGRNPVVKNAIPVGDKYLIEIRFRLIKCGYKFILLRTNDGWLGCVNLSKRDCAIYYYSETLNKGYFITNESQEELQQHWHILRVLYKPAKSNNINGSNNEVIITLDNKTVLLQYNSSRVPYITCLKVGNTDISRNFWGKLEIDFVRIVVYNSSIPYIKLRFSFILPPMSVLAVVLLVVGVNFFNLSASSSSIARPIRLFMAIIFTKSRRIAM